MGRIRVPWTPATTDTTGGGGRELGIDWSSDIDVSISGIWFWQPPTGTPTSQLTVTLFDQVTKNTLAQTAVGAQPTGWNLVWFTTPFQGIASTVYTAAVHLLGSGTSAGFTSGALSSPITDVTGHFTVTLGRFRETGANSPVYPDEGTGTFMHGIDVELEVQGGWGRWP